MSSTRVNGINVLRIEDLENDHIQISWQQGDSILTCQPVSFPNPLTLKILKRLTWYLEEYLLFPYGAERDKAQKVEKEMKEWGESLFNQVFTKCDCDPDPHFLYQEAVKKGLDTCELCIISEDTKFLMIPWELLREPKPGRYLAPLLKGLYRQRRSEEIEIEPSSGTFRILLVISRPEGEEDIPLQTVARPVLEALHPLRRSVELEVLRPPTFDELVERLHNNKGYYHVVHFDGHGIFGREPSAQSGSGYLVFEKEDGTEHIVSSQELGQELSTCRVPLFVLNACQSAREGRDPYSSVASQLVASGAEGVLAMSYSIYSTAVAKFMHQFYQALIDQKLLSEAVAAGRQTLYADSYRDSVVGPLKLQDWMIPVLYQKEYGYTPIETVEERDFSDAERVILSAQEVCPEGQFGFVGRDYDLLQIERALYESDHPWVVISGMGGCGKTALAFGFARWYAETGGCPGGVAVTSFKEKTDIGQVIGSIAGFGTDFSQLPQEKQLDLLIQYLRENECLLIWDNFETVTGYPEGSEPLATREEQKNLSKFLKRLKGGKTRVLITTRKPDERWLKIGYRLVDLKGLNQRDSGKLAESILKMVGRKPEDFRDDLHYSRLLTLLRGHPRSMEVVLPHLRDKSPAVIIEGLQHHLDELEDVLDASLTYVFPLLSQKTQKHLPIIGLFTSFVHEGIVTLFSEDEEYHYQEVMSELDSKGWKIILKEAASVGLIRSVGSGIYELHPTFPMFLRQKIVSVIGTEGLKRLNLEFIKFYGDLASDLFEEIEKGSEDALFLTAIEEANLLRALFLAETKKEWEIAQYIVQTLYGFYECRGRFNEWNALRNRLLDSIGYELPAGTNRDKASLWMLLLSEKAKSALERNELETAESTYQHIIDYLMSLNDEAVEPKIAVCYHQLGYVAQEQQQFDEAEKWYRKSLEINERLGLERDAADSYHQLGRIAEEQQQLDQAEKWYRKSLEIYEHLGLERYAAICYHSLGVIAQKQQQFDQAEKWYRKSLEIHQSLRHPPLQVDTLAQLGVFYREKNQHTQSVAWLGKALKIASEYNMHIRLTILVVLGLNLKIMGEEKFINAWKQEFKEDPPLKVIRKIWKDLENEYELISNSQ